jgi:hypothetical protein
MSGPRIHRILPAAHRLWLFSLLRPRCVSWLLALIVGCTSNAVPRDSDTEASGGRAPSGGAETSGGRATSGGAKTSGGFSAGGSAGASAGAGTGGSSGSGTGGTVMTTAGVPGSGGAAGSAGSGQGDSAGAGGSSGNVSTGGAPGVFIHPGILHTQAELDRMRVQVEANAEPPRTAVPPDQTLQPNPPRSHEHPTHSPSLSRNLPSAPLSPHSRKISAAV